MPNLQVYRDYGDELDKRLRPKTYPLALKLLRNERDIPEGAQRPKKNLGYQLSLCQTFQISRREGKTMAMLKEDHWCFEPVVGFGLGEPPDYFMQGNNRYPKDVATQEAGRHYAEQFPKLEPGKYIGITSAPLRVTPFEPDIVMIYCDAAQLSLLLLGREYRDGYNLNCNISGHAACVYGVVPALLKGECQVSVPCRGDHYRAMAGDEEMIFSVPRQRLDDLMTGLRYIDATGSRLPSGYTVCPEYPLIESYKIIGKMMGYIK